MSEACSGLVDDLVDAGFSLPSVYLLHGRRLRCEAARGYFQVVEGFAPGTGVIGSVVASGQTELVGDVSTRPDFIAAIPGLVAEACSAVRSGGAVVGAVSVESREPLPGNTVEVIEAAAAQIGRRIDELGGLPPQSSAQLLAQGSARLTAETDAAAIEQRTVDAAVDISAKRSAAIVGARVHGVALSAATGPLAERMALWDAGELAVLASWADAGTSSRFPGGHDVLASHAFLETAGIRALSVHPLVAGGYRYGWLVLADTDPLTEAPEIVELLEILAAQSAAALTLAEVRRNGAQPANQDSLTGLGNRAHLASTARAMLDARRQSNGRIALLLVGLDDFRHVNEALGHDVGDRLLVEVAQRIRTSLRDADVACRVGGDEFAIVMPDASHGTVVAIAERLQHAVSRAAAAASPQLGMSASIGITVDRASGRSAEDLLTAAELALYLAKERGKARYALFEPQLQDAAVHRLSLLSDLRRAIREDALSLAYQPIIDLTSGTMTGVEALVRWTTPERGPVSPGEFIPLAEDTGLILPLGEWVLRESCAQLLLWQAQGADPRLKVSVNVSTRQLDTRLLSVLDECLASGVAPSCLILEITETALGLDSAVARETLHAIRDRGVHLAVDDFGTGYSSLAMLRSSPVSRLKIDRQFVWEITAADADVPIVDATMAMARGLGLALVAEGVETSVQLAYLRDAGCPEAQGFLLARPLSAADLAPLVQGSRPWADVLTSITPPKTDVRSELAELIDLAVSPTADLDALVHPLLAELEAMTGLEMTYLTSVDADRTTQRVDVARSPEGSALTAGLVVPWEDTLCRRALTIGPQRTSDAQAAFPDAQAARELDLRTYIVEPVLTPDGELYGTLCAASRTPSDVSDADSATVRLFARLVTEKLRQVAASGVPAARGAAVQPWAFATDGDTQARVERRAAGARRWLRMRDARRHAARTILEAHPANEEARRQQALLEATQAAFDAHAARLGDDGGAAPRGASRVVLADDDAVMRQLMGAFVRANPALHLAAEATSGSQVIGYTTAEQPDILVLDYDLGDLTAEELVGDLRTFAPGTQILLYSGRSDVFELGQRLGVDRAVFKGDDVHRLVEALAALAS